MNFPLENPLPKALWVWNNQARRTLPPGLMAWLGLLVVTCLSSSFFLDGHVPARWALGGFIVSHLLVFSLPMVTTLTMRRGIVSLLHVLCWTPGLIFTLADFAGRGEDQLYAIWSCAFIVVLSISSLFDLRDAGTYLYYVATGRLQETSERPL